MVTGSGAPWLTNAGTGPLRSNGRIGEVNYRVFSTSSKKEPEYLPRGHGTIRASSRRALIAAQFDLHGISRRLAFVYLGPV